MGNPTAIGDILKSNLPDIDAKLRQRMLQHEIFRRWDEIFDKFADKIMPVRLEGDTLFVNSNDSALSDMLKYSARNFVDRINELMGSQIIAQIRFSGKAVEPPKKIVAPVEIAEPKKNLLTPAEIAELEKQVADIEEPLRRQKRLEYLTGFANAQKAKLARGWHKCELCGVLCKAEEKICGVCKVNERERMHSEIRRIFYEAPETPFGEVQEKICKSVPHMRAECTFEKIEAARMELILQTAARVSYGDTTSDRAKFLVRLARQLPEDKLTPAIIGRTLREFKYNLADLPKMEEQKFTKLPVGLRRTK